MRSARCAAGRQEGTAFSANRPELYTLTSLKDLAGVRVLVFPGIRVTEIDAALRERFSAWESDPVVEDDELLALKYSGRCRATDFVRAEYQIVSMLTGLFWEVEHSALYKPSPRFGGVARSLEMKARSATLITALRAFETEFENLVAGDIASDENLT